MPDDPRTRDPFAAGPLDRASAIALVQHADDLVAQGEYQQALPLYMRVVGHRDADLHVAALLGLAECQFRLDQDEAAVESWRLAAQGPETPLSWLAWRQLAAARVRQGDLGGALDAYGQAERRAPREARAEIASRLGWLNKELGNRRAAGRYFGKSRVGGVAPPYVTWTILAITIAVSLGQIVLPPETANAITNLFALDKVAVAHGEYYRLLSVVLVHGGLLHLAFNMYALYLVGPMVERIYGPAQYILMYCLAGIAGSVASFIFTPDPAVGASGAIFGLFGAVFVAYRIHHPLLGAGAANVARQIGFLIVFNLVLNVGLIGGGVLIDIFAHIGGLIAGMWLALVLLPSGLTLASLWQRPAGAAAPTQPIPGVLRAAAVGALVLAIIAGLEIGMVTRGRSIGDAATSAAMPAATIVVDGRPPGAGVPTANLPAHASAARAPGAQID